MELAIVKYIKEHGLAKALSTWRLKTRVYENKILLKYDQLESPFGNREVEECRGLVLERETWKVMSMGLTKFYNNGEGHAATIDWASAKILEKVDGTCIQLYYDWHKDTWFAGTTGTAEGEGEVNNKLGTTFNDLFWATVKKYPKFDIKKLWKEYTYVFELTTPYNIVVKPHGESSITLLACRNLLSLTEVAYDGLGETSEYLGVPLVKAYGFSATDVGKLLRTFENMVWTDEGYVVVDAKFNRIKVKNPAYVAVHQLKSSTAEHNIIGVVKTNEVEEFAATFPERREEIFILQGKYLALIDELEAAWAVIQTKKPKNITPQEKKRFAMELFNYVETVPQLKQFTGLFFSLKDGKVESIKDYTFNMDDKVLYKYLTGK